MDLKLKAKKALVTGSSCKGIGEAIARKLAAEGATVIVHGRDRALAMRVAHDIVANGGRAHAFIGDLTNDEDVERLIGDAEAFSGPIDIVVNSAGGSGGTNESWEQSHVESWASAYDRNVLAAVRVRHQRGDHGARFPGDSSNACSRAAGMGPRGDRAPSRPRVRRGARRKLRPNDASRPTPPNDSGVGEPARRSIGRQVGSPFEGFAQYRVNGALKHSPHIKELFLIARHHLSWLSYDSRHRHLRHHHHARRTGARVCAASAASHQATAESRQLLRGHPPSRDGAGSALGHGRPRPINRLAAL